MEKTEKLAKLKSLQAEYYEASLKIAAFQDYSLRDGTSVTHADLDKVRNFLTYLDKEIEKLECKPSVSFIRCIPRRR